MSTQASSRSMEKFKSMPTLLQCSEQEKVEQTMRIVLMKMSEKQARSLGERMHNAIFTDQIKRMIPVLFVVLVKIRCDPGKASTPAIESLASQFNEPDLLFFARAFLEIEYQKFSTSTPLTAYDPQCIAERFKEALLCLDTFSIETPCESGEISA